MSEGASFTIDVSAWPIVTQRMTGSLSDAQFDAFLAEASAVLSRGEAHVSIYDTQNLGAVTAYIRARTQQWMRTHRASLQECCLGAAYVVRSPVVRFIISASLLARRHATPVLVCTTMDEAVAWARQRLAAQGGRGVSSRRRW